jgi:CubicO group peptidase (beta-lactamase class C family)
MLRASNTPGAVVVVLRGHDVFIQPYGLRVHGTDDPVTAGTAFDIGSCSKSFVATAVARLVSDGRLGFDDRVKPIVPELELDEAAITDQITIRDLLCNRTGLKRQVPVESFANPEIRVEQIAARLKHLDRQHPFREGYVYFNPGFMVASLVVERLSGTPYAMFLEEELFRPLGMSGSASGLRPFEILVDRAVGHVARAGVPYPVTDEPVFDNWQGAAGVYSSGLDAARWLRLHLGTEGSSVVATEVLHELHTPHTRIPDAECKLIHKPPEAERCDYCMGWWSTELAGHRLVQHAGEMFGWRAHIALLPDDGIGAAVFTNSSADPVHQLLSYTVLEYALGETPRDWRAEGIRDRALIQSSLADIIDQAFPYDEDEPLPLPLDRYEGRYHHPACGELVVEAAGTELVLRMTDGRLWDTRLSHLGGNVFKAEFERISVRDYMPVPFRARFETVGNRVVAVEDQQARYLRLA